MAYTEINYGSQGPEDIDRFGTRQTYDLWGVNGPDHVRQRIQPFDALKDYLQPRWGPLRRLGLVLGSWREYRGGVEHYSLSVNGRYLQIRSYADGRIQLYLDDRFVYQEKTEIVTRSGNRERVWRISHDEEIKRREWLKETEAQREEQEAESERRIADARERLKKKFG
ncbi:hypothetical protein SEA_SKOG_142 [Gordonia phage Skog]|uniref:Uncharacterized protein n=1 Tax=Gordonia phage Skog TaxID=2704033 RepID=A0A6G6XJV4_9CAUD|nr:hypothetical protein KHQ85_gp142 [Gordonia phage Skog]QIG58294.1 hypothetical protein SEA_SKOG_142 [Gordonia phage Skog]